jgi:hypothetical protein
MGKDLVIGAVSNYNYHDIEPWLVSLKRTGYKGRIALVTYNMSKETAEKLVDEGVTYIFGLEKDSNDNFVYSNQNFSIMIERFAHMYYFLDNLKEDIDFVFATDVKDVIFQTNPSDFMENMFLVGTRRKKLVLGSENLKYQDEPWGKNNMMQCFGPLVYERVKNNPIYCAGVIAGEKRTVMELFLNMFLLCRGAPSHPPGGGGPDQAALNVMLSFDAFKKQAWLTGTEEAFVLHAGTTTYAIKSGSGDIGMTYKQNPSVLNKYKESLMGKEPIFKDGIIYTDDGVPYCIVHQYNRVNEWADVLDKKYRDK